MSRAFRRGASLFVAASFASSVHAADPSKQAEGKKAFATGVNLVNDPDGARYEEALPLFRKAYLLLSNWKVLGNVGICAMKTERDGEAIDAFDRYLKDGGKELDAGERTQVTRDLDTLRVQAASVHLDYPSGSEYLLDQRLTSNGAQRTNRYELTGSATDLRLHPGIHKMALHGSGHPDITWDTELSVGGKSTHRFDAQAPPMPSASVAPLAVSPSPAPSPPARSGLPTSAYVAGGVTVALILGAVVTGIVANSKHSTFESINGQPGHSASEIDSARSSGKSMALVSTVLTGAAIVGAGVTVYFSLSKRSDDGPRSGAWWGVGPGSMSAGGTF